MRTFDFIALLSAAAVAQSASGPSNWLNAAFSGATCTSYSQCTTYISKNATNNDPGFEPCCATITAYYNGVLVVNKVSQCFPMFIGVQSNGTNLTIGNYTVSATCMSGSTSSTSHSCST